MCQQPHKYIRCSRRKQHGLPVYLDECRLRGFVERWKTAVISGFADRLEKYPEVAGSSCGELASAMSGVQHRGLCTWR